ECGKRLRTAPVGLGDDSDPEALCFEHAPDDRHAEARMVDVSIPADDDDVAAVPAEDLHFGARQGQERGRAEALGPVFAVARDFRCGVHDAPGITPELAQCRSSPWT